MCLPMLSGSLSAATLMLRLSPASLRLLNGDDSDCVGGAGVDRDWAHRYAAWFSRREGRVFRLPHQDEYEKASRGVDGRAFPWGPNFYPPCANTIMGAEDHGTWLRQPGSFPIDESPYGVFDTAGNLSSLCWNGLSHLEPKPTLIGRGRARR